MIGIGSRRRTRPVPASSSITLRCREIATQTASPWAAMLTAPRPTLRLRAVALRVWRRGSARHAARVALMTHRSAFATAMPRGRKPTFSSVSPTRGTARAACGEGDAAARSTSPPVIATGREDRHHGRRGSRASSAPATTARFRRVPATVRGRRHRPRAVEQPRQRRRRTGRGGAARHRPLRPRLVAPGGRARRAAEVARGGLAVLGGLGQRALHDLIERGGKPGPQRRRQRRRLGEMRPQPRLVALAVVRDRAGEHEMEHAAERVDVGAGVDGAAADLLRRGEVERADPAARLGQAARRERVLGEAEVREVDVAALVDQHVGRLDVAMHVARAVDRIERVAERDRDRGRTLGGQRAVAAHERAQVVSVHVAHDEVGLTVRPRPRRRRAGRSGARRPRRRAPRSGSARACARRRRDRA